MSTRYRMSPWLTKMNVLGVELTATDDGWFTPPSDAIEAAMKAAGAQPEGAMGNLLASNTLPAAEAGAIEGGVVVWISASDGFSKIGQALADQKSMGPGRVRFVAGEYEWDGSTTYNVDTAFNGIDFGSARIHIPMVSGATADTRVFNMFSSVPIHPVSEYQSFLEYTHGPGGMFFGDGGNSESEYNAELFYMSSPTLDTSNRVAFRGIRANGLKTPLAFKDRSYMVKGYGLDFSGNVYGMRQYAGMTGGAVKNEFHACNLNENIVAILDAGGNSWEFIGGSMDYNKQFIRGSGGSSLSTHGMNLEFNYGSAAGETLVPFALSGANAALFIDKGALRYRGSNRDPYWSSLVSIDNSAQKIIIRPSITQGLGRVRATKTGYDTMIISSANAKPYIEVHLVPPGIDPADIPAEIYRCDVAGGNGIGGKLRYGSENIYAELINRIAVIPSSVSATALSNDGNGTVGTVTLGSTAKLGDYYVTFLAATKFKVTDPDGIIVGKGSTGTVFTGGGLSFTITAGATAFSAGDMFKLTASGAGVTNVTADENGMTRKNGRNCIKPATVGAGAKWLLSFEIEDGKWPIWSVFVNTVAMTGSFTVKERTTGFQRSFDGSRVMHKSHGVGAQYSATTKTVSAVATDQWVELSWKDCRTEFSTATQMKGANVVTVEFDFSGVTGGAPYFSHANADAI